LKYSIDFSYYTTVLGLKISIYASLTAVSYCEIYFYIHPTVDFSTDLLF